MVPSTSTPDLIEVVPFRSMLRTVYVRRVKSSIVISNSNRNHNRTHIKIKESRSRRLTLETYSTRSKRRLKFNDGVCVHVCERETTGFFVSSPGVRIFPCHCSNPRRITGDTVRVLPSLSLHHRLRVPPSHTTLLSDAPS